MQMPDASMCRGSLFPVRTCVERANDESSAFFLMVAFIVSLFVTSFSSGYGSDSQPAAVAFQRGEKLSRQGDLDSSISAYTEAIRLDPREPKAYVGRASAYFRNRDFEKAIADYTEVIRLDSRLAGARIGRGCAYCQKREFDKAIADFSEAIRLDPKDGGKYENRAIA